MEPASSEPDHRQLRRDFQSITEGTRRFDSTAELLETYAAPLARIFGADALPPSLKANLNSAAPSSSSPSNDNVDVLLVEAVQESLLYRVVLDFSHSLERAQLQELLEAWFFGPSSAHDSPRGAIQPCALRTLSRLLSSATASPAHPITLEWMNKLCLSALELLCLPALISAVLAERNRARADVVWTETLRLLSSLPDRLANANEGRLPQGFSTDRWIKSVLVTGIAKTLNVLKLETSQIRLLKDVIGRLQKMAYLTRAVDTEGRGFWITFLEAALKGKDTARNWPELRARLGKRLRTKLDLRLMETLQYLLVVRQGGSNVLVTPGEKTNPGTEGTGFLSKTSQKTVAALAVVLGTFFKHHTSSLSSEDDVSSSDSDEEASPELALFKNVALSRTPQFPLLAWSWSTYLASHLPASGLLVCLEHTLDLWSDSNRLSHALLEEEVYITTLILTLLATIRDLDEEDSTRLAAISRSRSVLDGVSSHLSHTDGTIRVLGMLVAEMMSSKVPSPSGKVLNFGKGVWNGSGNGREECRVLRALHDAWEHHRKAIREIGDEWGDAGLVRALEALGITASNKAGPNESKQMEVAPKKEKSKPKSRALPERVPPPVRSGSTSKPRPLITMIDSDEEDPGEQEASTGPLSMFTNLKAASRTRADSVSSSSSSSDGSDSDIADATEGDIQKLAAELSGLTPGEASSALASDPSSLLSSMRKSRRTRTRADDFDADQESHAPTFTKPSPAPVYISQLSPLLKSSSRADIKLALEHAAALIRLKSHIPTFGNELRENAVDLTLTLVALHDNYGIKGFERMRVEALKWLVVGAPMEVVAVLGEQVFGSQYSGAQKVAMLAAIAEGALELSGKREGGEGSGKAVGAVVDEAVGKVIAEAREVGESKVPALRRQRNLEIGGSSRAGAKGKLVQVINPSSSSSSSTMAKVDAASAWDTLVGPLFLFPFINRFLAYHHAFTRRSRSDYLGAGTSGLFTADVISLLVDTLTLLLSFSPATLLPSLTGPLLELILTLLPTSNSAPTPELASTLNMLALLLHRNLETDAGEALLNDQQALGKLRTLLPHVQELFAALQDRGSSSGAVGASEGVRMKILSRAAAVLLLLDQLDQQRQEMVRRLIGFVPA